eukprot:XP_001702312.1 ERD4-related membrane protein [Chlamydomonas reinhardtii]
MQTVTRVLNSVIFMNGTLNGNSTIRVSILANATLVINGTFLYPGSNNTETDLMYVTGDLYATTDTVTVNNNQYKFTDFDKYSLSNVEAGSPKMWAHLVSMYVVVIYAMWLITRFNREAVLLRLMFLGNAKRGGPSHTVLVTDVPGIVTGVTDMMNKAVNKIRTHVSGDGADTGKKKRTASGGVTPMATATQTPRKQPLPPNPNTPGTATSHGGASAAAIGAPAAAAAATLTTRAEEQPASPAGVATADEVAAAAAEMGATLVAAEAAVAPGVKDPAQEQVLSEMEEIQRGLEQVAREKQQREHEREKEQQEEEEQVEEEVTGEQQVKAAAAPAASGDASPKGRTGPGPVAEGVEPEAGGSTSGANARSGGGDSGADPGAIAVMVHGDGPAAPKSAFLEAGPEAAVAAGQPAAPPAQQLRRRRFQVLDNKYDYNLSDQRLNPWFQAREKVEAGMTPEQMVRSEFELVYGAEDICVVNMVQNTRALQPLVDEYNKVQQSLEDYLDMLQLRLKLRKKAEPQLIRVLGMAYGEWGKSYFGTKWFKKVDAVTFWLDRLRYLKEQVLLQQVKAINKAAPSAFVTFKCVTGGGAPAPFEIVWSNLSMNIHEKSSRVVGLWVVFWLMTLFFMIPVTLIQAMIEVPKLATVDGLGPIVTAPVIKQLLEAIIPGLVLKIFLAIVPIILKAMAIMSGTTSLSEVDFGVVKRFFLFQVVVVFFGNIIAGSFFNQLTQWVEDPASVIPTLGKSIPMTATFFITYLFTTGMFVKTLQFVRLPGFVIYWLLNALAGSPRAKDRLWMFQYTDFGRTVAEHTTAMLIGIVFSCMNPIVCLAAWTYFLATYLGERYNNIYVYRRQYESAGRLWGTVFGQVMVGLYIMELTMLGLLAIKKFKWTPLAIPLVIITIGFHISNSRIYNKPWHSVPALSPQQPAEITSSARSLDEMDMSWMPCSSPNLLQTCCRAFVSPSAAAEEANEVTKLYKNPCFKVPLMDLERIEALAADVLPRVDVLNKWRAELKAQGKKAVPAAGKAKKPHPAAGAEEGKVSMGGSSTASEDEDSALIPPPEVTRYDDLHVEKDESDGEEKME